MNLRLQRRLASDVMGCSGKDVTFSFESDDDKDALKKAITKRDIRLLISAGLISRKPLNNSSRGRIRKAMTQRCKGRRSGHGSRKGKKTARQPRKEAWMKRIRLARIFLKTLRGKKAITPKNYRMLYLKAKGGFFRSKRHIKLYIDEHKLAGAKQQ